MSVSEHNNYTEIMQKNINELLPILLMGLMINFNFYSGLV